MSAKPQPKRMTVAEYLAHERAAEFKGEFIDGRLYPLHNSFGPADVSAMAGATRAHNRVKDNLVGELFGRLKPCGCEVYSSDQRVRVSATGRYTYPCRPAPSATGSRASGRSAP